MAQDLITRLKLENEQYNRKLQQSQSMLQRFGVSGKEAGQALSILDSKLGTCLSSFGKLTLGVGATSAALKVSVDAFSRNEVALDEWKENIEAANSVYDSFLNAINTGDFSGFLNNIGQVISAAREAYDALDELGTFNAFNQINTEKARTELTDAMSDYRMGTGSRESIENAATNLKSELQQRADYEKNAYEARIKELAASRNVDVDMLRSAMSGSYGDYRSLKETQLTGRGTSTVGGGMFGSSQTIQTQFAANETEKLGEMLRKLTDEELQGLQALGAQAQRTSTEIASIDRQTARILGGGRSTTGPTTGPAAKQRSTADITGVKADDFGGLSITTTESMNELNTKLREWQKKLETATDQFQAGEAQNNISYYQRAKGAQGEALSRGVSVDTILAEKDAKDKFRADLETYIKDNPLPVAIDSKSTNVKKTAEDVADSWSQAAAAINSACSALGQIENPAAKVSGILAEAIANIALSFAMALKDTKGGPWAWIAAAAAGTATVIGTIASIKSATAGSFAEGGIVPGNSFSGDRLTANVNSGELILNRAQQSNIASQLSASGLSNISLSATIKGETVRLALNNSGKRRGRGEYIKA